MSPSNKRTLLFLLFAALGYIATMLGPRLPGYPRPGYSFVLVGVFILMSGLLAAVINIIHGLFKKRRSSP